MARWTGLVSAIVEYTFAIPASFTLSAGDIVAGVTKAVSLHAGLAFWAENPAAGVLNTSSIHTGLEERTTELRAAWNALTVSTKLTDFTIG